MNFHYAKEQFNDNVKLFGNQPEKYNLYNGLANLADGLQVLKNEIQSIKNEINRIKPKI